MAGDLLDEMEGGFSALPFSYPLDPATKQFKNSVTLEKNKAHAEKSRAKPYSDKQQRYLSFLLGGGSEHGGYKGLEAFVRFANGYHHGHITAVHYMQAIALAKDGFNWYGSARHLVEISFDV